MSDILVVGAGFAGGVVARELAEAGRKVLVIDKRNHIGGNAYDYVNNSGERIHQYGPHLLHGDASQPAIKWLSRFTEWLPYEHRVRAQLSDGRSTPLPVNRTTLEDVFGVRLDSDEAAAALLEREVIKKHITNTDDFFLANVGPKLADIFFRPYTRKMWGVDPALLESSVGARLPVRLNRDDRYFTDTFQAMPSMGYSHLFENIFDHSNIKVELEQPFQHDMPNYYDHVFTSAPIDVHYNYLLGKLPYRSIKFEQIIRDRDQQAPVINFTDTNIYTRRTQWDLIPNSGKSSDGKHTCTLEIPCTPEQNRSEYYYPIRNQRSTSTYHEYQQMSKYDKKITFIGRTGLFLYIDMVPCVNMHLRVAKVYLARSS